MRRCTSCPWAWTQSSRSTPTSPMHNLSFTSRVWWSCSVENFIWKNTRRVWLMKTFEFTHVMEGIGSTHRGIVETYTTSFNSKYHQLESRAWLAKSRNRIYQRHYVSKERITSSLNMKDLLNKSNKGSGGPQRIWCEYRHTTRGRKNARTLDYRNNWLTQSSNANELRFSNQGIRSQQSD